MKEILLTQGKVALVDDDDYEWLNQWKWNAHKNGNTLYAKRGTNRNADKKTILMHRVITNCPNGYVIDHIDGNGLNNQRSNLRIVTNRQNLQNRHTSKSSLYPGVTWNKENQKWAAQIRIPNQIRRQHLGYFKTELEAYQAYCKALESIGETPLLLRP